MPKGSQIPALWKVMKVDDMDWDIRLTGGADIQAVAVISKTKM